MNNKGFALAITMALLPVLLGLGLLLFTALGIMQFNQQTQYMCRSGGLQGQKLVAPLLKSLLALNSLAVKLKADEALAQARLYTAMATGNATAIATAEMRLLKIQEKRADLDQKQKMLIRESNRLLSINHKYTQGKIRQALQEGLPKISYLKIDFQLNPTTAPELAVRPDYTDIAPTYSPVDKFDEQQALAHSWQYRLRVRNSFQNFLDGDIKWSPSCSVTLKQEGSSWVPKIRKAKSSSKSQSLASF
ncbi:hypothetical protein [Bdellovibrio sp. HCB2-146]|uniref:hypothetical protein n=1 Tax=Bdellovibrio sp. HCB2-146 TaxID=3394362 RepID=UPI0039BCEA7E